MRAWILALALAACAPAQAPQEDAAEAPAAEADSAEALTPDGLGALRVGMTAADLVAQFGGPDAANMPADPTAEACLEFHPARAPEGVWAMVENGAVTRVVLTAPSDVKTADGLGVGADAAAVRAALGDQAVQEPHKYQGAPAAYLTAWRTRGADAADAPYVSDPAARGVRYVIGETGAVEAIHAGGPSIQYVESCS
ncbi:MAG: hypothetical protein GC189_03875 [Alphaproteobacteria bacterium]|nr:hypothetical protein [Alphaproteobacteria bacterium]